jgi:hypothetical protein
MTIAEVDSDEESDEEVPQTLLLHYCDTTVTADEI